MKTTRVISLAASLLPAALYAQTMDVTPQQQTLIADIPTSSAESAEAIFTELGKDAEKLVPEFVSHLSTEKGDADTTARFALGGLVWTVGHSGSAEQKAQLARLIADSIPDANGVEPKSFLIEQLQYMNQDSVADKLYPLVTDKDLGPRAIRTLAALKPEGLEEQLLGKLNDSNTSEVQTGIILTIARLAPDDAAGKIAPLADAENPFVRAAALDALAAIGDPASRDVLKEAAAKSETLEDVLAPARYLNYARSLAAADHRDLAAEVCREVVSADHTTETVYLVGLALTTLADLAGEESLDDQFEHVRDDAEDVRATALDNINRFKGEAVTTRVVEELESSPDPEVTVAILLALGDRKDASALPAVASKFADENAVIAATAVDAAGEIDRPKALQAMLDALKTDKDNAVVDAIANQLTRLSSDVLAPAIATAIPAATPAGQVVLIKLLGERRASAQKEVVFEATKSEDAKVRAAAYDALGRVAEAADLSRLRDMMLAADSNAERKSARQAFVTAAKDSGNAAGRSKLLMDSLATAGDEGKVTILEAMAALADNESLKTVTDLAATSATPELQDAAVRALSEWQSQDAVPELKEIAKNSKVEKHQVLAVRGYARLAGEVEDKEKKTEMLADALSLAKRADERKTIISQLGDIKSTAALEAVSPFVGRKGVEAEAAAAAIKIAMPTGDRDNGIKGAETIETLERALEATTDEKRKPVEKYIYELIREIESRPDNVDEDGFVVLFNGKDLSGWCGDTEGYAVEDGVLVCRKDGGGKLFTEEQFGDFVMRFDFKLQAGGNNGVGIRTPLHGDSAYAGMEIQILDDKDPQYDDIKPWQSHGSVYGIAAAEPADLKIGEWNTEEISVVGRNVKVTVNGKVITDVNLDDATKDGIVSGKPHPGVNNSRGHLGFLGHHHRVEFKNIRVKHVANDSPPEGFTKLFNGENLDGWKGLVANPIKRKAMPAEKLKSEQETADEKMNAHWSIDNGILFFDGEGSHLCTTKDYRNFEMLVDWCIPPGGDNGIYLRGAPQVQIWDPHYWPQGSGGLYNNKKGTSDPLTLADNRIGQWNTFRIKMVDEKVTVHLNDKLVVDNVVLENYFDRDQPIFPKEQIELQSHGSPAWWRNIYIKELPE